MVGHHFLWKIIPKRGVHNILVEICRTIFLDIKLVRAYNKFIKFFRKNSKLVVKVQNIKSNILKTKKIQKALQIKL